MTNERIKLKMFQESIPQWKVAKALGIGETTLTRKLREELPEDKQEEILQIIDNIVRECAGNE